MRATHADPVASTMPISANARPALIIINRTKPRCAGYEEPMGARLARSPGLFNVRTFSLGRFGGRKKGVDKRDPFVA